MVAERLKAWGHEDFTSYVVWACERAMERGMLPHTNLGVLSKGDLARLREVTASQGLMLESVDERLMETVHAGSPTKAAGPRLDTLRAAGELKIPFTTGILVGIGESFESRVESLEAIAKVHEEYGHIQEVILQNFVPHPRYYGAEVAEIANEASKARWSGDEPAAADVPLPDWAAPVDIEEIKRLIAESKRLMPDVGVQVPPNLSDWWPELVEAGATDLGGLSANGDHISPEEPFPSPHQVRKELAPRGFALTERLCVYPQYMDMEWMEQGVLDVIKLKYWSFIPRRGSGRRSDEELDAALAPRAIEKGREGIELTEDEMTALFAETRPEVIEEMRIAADELRAELAGDVATFVVNRNINFTNICVVGCAFCGFGQGKRSPDAYEVAEPDFASRIVEAVDFGATELCMQGGIHPDLTLEEYGRWLRLAKDTAPQLHLHAYSPMEINHACAVLGQGARGSLRVPARLRARLDPGDRGRGARRRGPPADLPEQAPGGALGRDHRSLPPRRAALDLDRDVRPHRGAA